MGEEGYQFSAYELGNKLRPPAEMNELERRQELAGYDRADHPRFTGDQKVRLQIADRITALMRAGQPAPSDLAQQLERQGIKTKEDLDQISNDAFMEMERSKAEREWNAIKN